VTRQALSALIDEHIARALRQKKSNRPQADVDKLQAKLDELAALYADDEITAREWIKAREPIERKLTLAQRAVAADIDIASEPKTILREWRTYSIPQKQAVIKLLFSKIEVGKATPGRKAFDPDRVNFQPSANLDLSDRPAQHERVLDGVRPTVTRTER
jgi:hypothetical protein